MLYCYCIYATSPPGRIVYTALYPTSSDSQDGVVGGRYQDCITGKMLDSFEILTSSGVVLWSKYYASVNPNIVNSFINDIFIEEKKAPRSNEDGRQNQPYKKEKYTVKWSGAKDLGLVFVVRDAMFCDYILGFLTVMKTGSLSISCFIILDRQIFGIGTSFVFKRV